MATWKNCPQCKGKGCAHCNGKGQVLMEQKHCPRCGGTGHPRLPKGYDKSRECDLCNGRGSWMEEVD